MEAATAARALAKEKARTRAKAEAEEFKRLLAVSPLVAQSPYRERHQKKLQKDSVKMGTLDFDLMKSAKMYIDGQITPFDDVPREQ